MAELNSLTVKKLDIAIASFNDQKKRKENLSNSTQKKLDGLIKKYTQTKTLILTTYQKNKTHKNLIGIDKSTLSVIELAHLLGKKPEELKTSYKGTNAFIGIMSASSALLIAGEQIAKNVTGAEFAAAMDAIGTAIGNFFKDVVLANPLTTIGVLGIASALTVGAVVLIKKKLKDSKDKKMLMEQEAEEKMNASQKGRKVENFQKAANVDELAEEIANDPELRAFVTSAMNSSSPAISPIMKMHMAKALQKAANMNAAAAEKTEKIQIQTRIIDKANQADLDAYAKAVEDEKLLAEATNNLAIAKRTNKVVAAGISNAALKTAVEDPAFKALIEGQLTSFLATSTNKLENFAEDFYARKCSTNKIGTVSIPPAAVPLVKNAIQKFANEVQESKAAEAKLAENGTKLGITGHVTPAKLAAKRGEVSVAKAGALKNIAGDTMVHDATLDEITALDDSAAVTEMTRIMSDAGMTYDTSKTVEQNVREYEIAQQLKVITKPDVLEAAIAEREAAKVSTK